MKGKPGVKRADVQKWREVPVSIKGDTSRASRILGNALVRFMAGKGVGVSKRAEVKV
jgi:hypothetical protein